MNRRDAKVILDYVNTPLSKEDMNEIYNIQKITQKKCGEYSKFIQMLLSNIFSTYLGDDVIDSVQRLGHFKWCWNKTLNDWSKKNVKIQGGELYNYFLEFTIEVFYKNKDKKTLTGFDTETLKIWVNIFDFDRLKSQNEMDTLVEVYNLFEQSLNKKSL